MAEIELTVSFPTIIRDTVEDAEARRARRSSPSTASRTAAACRSLLGSPETIAETLRPYLELGFSTVIVRMPAPFDRETIDRLPEVRALLGG